MSTKSFCLLSAVLLIAALSCTDAMWGVHWLGNNVALTVGDRIEDRIIEYCEGNCNGGIYFLPTYARHYDSTGHYAEYVQEAKSNKNWIIAKTFRIKEKQENYWIISKNFSISNLDCGRANCDSILQSHVTGPLSLPEFQDRVKTLNVGLRFK
jgi:hypothetical protein